MEIKGKVHCFFEQSGTFKNEFIKLGIPAEDYDIQNNLNPKTVYGTKSSSQTGVCSEERSLISPTYAHNFINDQILGNVNFLKPPILPTPKV